MTKEIIDERRETIKRLILELEEDLGVIGAFEINIQLTKALLFLEKMYEK